MSIPKNEIELFGTANYKVYETIGADSHEMEPVKCTIDTSACQNFAVRPFLYLMWVSGIRPQRFIEMKRADQQQRRSEEVIISHK